MSKNIVFFGKAETGKSTLAGYLYAHKLSDKDKNKIWNNRRKELGVLYDYQERFSYLLDNYFEIKRHKEEKSGTTRTLHIENISDDFNIIDTPALTHSQYQISHKGIFMGDIGVYMIEASKVKKMSEKILQYKEIFLWSKLKENDTLLVLISISDLLEEIELKSVYEEIVDLFNGELKMNLKIIPISINRNEGTDCNVYTKAYNWYKGKTLIETLDSMIEQNESNLKDFCVFIDRTVVTYGRRS